MSEHTDRTNPKPPSVDRLSELWRRINDHKMVQWSVAYVALAYGTQHAVTLITEAFEWPHAVERVSMLLLALGLPLVITLAWYHGARASRQFSKAELSILSALLVIGSLLFYAFVQPSTEVAAGAKPAAQGVAAARAVSTSVGNAISIAVLPFANVSGDPGQEFFSDGMSDEIIAALAKVPSLQVVARTSAFQFKGEKKDMRAIGQALNARYLIDGSVRKAGDRVRITAQLVQADNGVGVWTESYDRELKDIFATQSDIAQAIAGALRVPLGLKQGDALVSGRSIDPESYQQYLHAKALVRARGAGVTEAINILEPLVARNPDYAPAWAQLAFAYGVTPQSRRNSSAGELRRVVDVFLPKAEAAARRAIQLDPNLADGYLFLGRVQVQHGKLLLAEELYSKALALDANNPDVLNQYSNILADVGRLKEALAMRQQLRALEPFVPGFNANLAEVLWLNGQNDAAIAMAKDLPVGERNILLARIYAAMGRYREAADVLQELSSTSAPPEMLAAAVRLLRTAPAPAASPQTLPRFVTLGFVYLHVGAPSRALELFEDEVEAGLLDTAANPFLWHLSYAPVRKTERFKVFVRAAGYVDYWRAKGWPEFCHPTTADDFVCD